jgi:hypothetical protein
MQSLGRSKVQGHSHSGGGLHGGLPHTAMSPLLRMRVTQITPSTAIIIIIIIIIIKE